MMRDREFPSPKATCPHCGGRQSLVLKTRPSQTHPGGVWRRRQCLGCPQRYSTLEQVTVFRNPMRRHVHAQ